MVPGAAELISRGPVSRKRFAGLAAFPSIPFLRADRRTDWDGTRHVPTTLPRPAPANERAAFLDKLRGLCGLV